MTSKLTFFITLVLMASQLFAQVEPTAGTWKTWFISSGKDYRLPAPPDYKREIAQVLAAQQALDSAGRQQILYWNAGSPGYHWQEMIGKLWMTDTGRNGVLSNMLLGAATYDAIIAAWDTKYAYNRPRPFEADRRVKALAPKPESPSYPCEHAVAAGVAVAIISRIYPALADSVQHMAQRLMTSRIAAGMAFPSDTKAGYELGKRIAEKELEATKEYVSQGAWQGKIPTEHGKWTGKFAMYPTAMLNKTVVLDSASQYRPGPPPDYAKEMEEMRNFKQTFSSRSNAFYWASQNFWGEVLHKKIFEYNLQSDAPKAARIYALTAIAAYDGFIACWDAKYTYWGIRPNQYDTTYKALVPTPPFPGYPSGHALMSGMFSELYSYFFPAERPYFMDKAKDAAESRFQAGIHFRTDNEVGLDLGRKVADAVIARAEKDKSFR